MTTTSDKKKPQKISFKISSALLNLFNAELQHLPISRDLFLSNLIKTECEHLAADLSGKRLSDNAKTIISYHLKNIHGGSKQLSMVINPDVATRLNEIVKETNIVRDSFLNLIIYYLLLTDTFRKRLNLPEDVDAINTHTRIEGRLNGILIDTIPMSPFKWLSQVLADPFRYLREELSHVNGDKTELYLVPLPEKLLGFTCYSEDEFIPGTDLHEQINNELSKAAKDF